jgi:hypothetical protein
MGVDRFVVTLVDTKQGRQEERRWSKADVSQSMAWLKRMNARGYDVWIRPDGENGMALLGGLNKHDLHTLRERGFAPAAVVEIGPEQYQAWVKLSERGLDGALRNQASAGLVKGLGLSGANAISRADGRLAGFTNQQVMRTDGRHPYALLTESEGKLAPAGQAYLARFEFEQSKSKELASAHQLIRSRGHTRG